MPTNFLIITGEISAEVLTAPLVRAIKTINPDISLWGIGGDILRNSGFEPIANNKDLAVMGFLDVLSSLPKALRLSKKIIKECERRKPDVVIFVDFPGFNLRLAEALYRRRASANKPKLIYYITPQVWAWNKKRIEKLKAYFDYLIPILPFEYYLFTKEGLGNVRYFGHPLVSLVKPSMSESEFRESFGISNEFIVLMPGSRKMEVKRILPAMINAFRELRRRLPIDGVIICAPNLTDYIEKMASTIDGLRIVHGPNYDPLFYGKLAIVTSGTATLECAIANIPLIVVYRTDWLTYTIAKSLVKLPYISLVNILAQKKIVPELIQNEANSERMISTAYLLLQDEDLLNRMRTNLKAISSRLGPESAPNDIGKFIVGLIS